MRTFFVGAGLVALCVGCATAAGAQGWVTDARRIGLGGLGLDQGSLRRYNAAYRAVPGRAGQRGRPKLTIPIPLGLIQFFHDHPLSNIKNDPAFNHDSAGFNPVELLNTFLNPPLFLEVKKAPTPTNDVVFGIGKDSLRLNLGQTAKLVPEDQFGIGGSSRPLDAGLSIKGVRVGVMGWVHGELGFQLGDKLLGFLRDSVPAAPNTRYNIPGDAVFEAGFAPSIGYAGRIVGDSTTGLYVGGAFHYYVGLAYARVNGDGGFTTGDSIFSGPTPVKLDARGLTQYSKFGNSVGHGVGGDIGIAVVTGPIELGVGVNDIAATITWPDTRVDSALYRDSSFSKPVANHIETKTKLPVSYLVNLAYTVGKTTLGADVLNSGRGTTVHVGGEQRVGVLVLRGGVARDQRKRMEFGWGGGLRFGGLGVDLGFWTHTNSLSNQRGVTMATSLSIY
ncbi:MAG: hypothetical protein AUH78_03325 [Gemmatimonadetes bacterium 13_1_40CM_4_69_8]|nr:MAG: hypothetical protein AUH45_00790 [Gemmatimonadetes bacterium 13_1_40CM_69_22]OLC77954.1 MAG: hypothetical protein AUH78_03325 [Gemmatimonadetes bacterium 13_1_40CM_4_69_8]